MKAPTREQMENFGSLITIKGTNNCLGDLMYLTGHGIFDATYGRVDVTPEEATAHNTCLDTAKLEGMDKNCEIGKGAFFYYTKPQLITTFIGTTVCSGRDISVNGSSITFVRAGKTYRGRLPKDSQAFNFKRIK
jgi:hypothetical protein